MQPVIPLFSTQTESKIRVTFGAIFSVICIFAAMTLMSVPFSYVIQLTAAIIVCAGVFAGGFLGLDWRVAGVNSLEVLFMKGPTCITEHFLFS